MTEENVINPQPSSPLPQAQTNSFQLSSNNLEQTPTVQNPKKGINLKILALVAVLFILVLIIAGIFISTTNREIQKSKDQQTATISNPPLKVETQNEFEKIGKVTPGPSPSPDVTNFHSDYYAFNLPNGWLVSKNGLDFEAYDPNHLPYRIMIKNFSRIDSNPQLADQEIKSTGTIEQKYIYRVAGKYGTGGVSCFANEEKCEKQYVVISKDKIFSAVVYVYWDKITIQDLVNQHKSADEINNIINTQSLIDPNISTFESNFFGNFRFTAKP